MNEATKRALAGQIAGWLGDLWSDDGHCILLPVACLHGNTCPMRTPEQYCKSLDVAGRLLALFEKQYQMRKKLGRDAKGPLRTYARAKVEFHRTVFQDCPNAVLILAKAMGWAEPTESPQ